MLQHVGITPLQISIQAANTFYKILLALLA
jgi:hypothetical protein